MGPLLFASRSTLKGPGIFDLIRRKQAMAPGAIRALAGWAAQFEALRPLFLAIPGSQWRD
ncbi:MAG TPA: hypothetical protein VJM10_04185 [Candidatus Methylomirabilis sp.]|nr:hypothetical protein [Candidatus Methylomirabilis sp.]